jgi:NNP family nitrate/nitrite transporter-like MFS transporter
MADYLKALGDRDSWWFMFFYSVTFGGFIGLASALPGYFNDQYGLSPVTAGYYTAACVFAGSLMRPLGGAWPTASAASAPCWACTAWRRLHCRRLQPAQRRRTGPVRLRHARPGRRQWRGVPAGAAALSPGDRRDDRADRHGRRHRRLPAGGRPGHRQATHRHYQMGLWLFASLGVLAWFGLHGVKQRWRTTWGSAAVTAARV